MTAIHLIGIGGTGLSAIARYLHESGYTVSGSDRQLSPLAKDLQEAGVQVFIGHRAENVRGANLVVRSSAIRDDNPEVRAALEAGIPVVKRSDFLGRLMANRTGIAVAGTHGKTTSSAMIAWMLSALGEDPSFIIGGVLKNLGVNARAGKGETFVIEADEYDRMFLGLQTKIAIVTNLEHDHPDCFPTQEDYYQAFLAFARHLPEEGLLLACSDDPGARRLMAEVKSEGRRVLGYGIGSNGDERPIRAENLHPNSQGGYSFDAILGPSQNRIPVTLQVPGLHNVRNALAALGTAWRLVLPLEIAAHALSEYQGTGRRFELAGETGGVTVIDDYAHHPTEIQATLAAARARYPKQAIWAVWQPHTYSRTHLLYEQFKTAFGDADHVIVTEIYPAREPVEPGFSSRQLVVAMQHPDACFVPDFESAIRILSERLRPGDVLLVLSAGDADQISAQVLVNLEERSQAHV